MPIGHTEYVYQGIVKLNKRNIRVVMDTLNSKFNLLDFTDRIQRNVLDFAYSGQKFDTSDIVKYIEGHFKGRYGIYFVNDNLELKFCFMDL